MNKIKWLVIGISGATCSGKTTLAQSLKQRFMQSEERILAPNVKINEVKIINQDDYFLQVDDPRHVHVPILNHINWEIPTALDLGKMGDDIRALLRSVHAEDQPPTCESQQRHNAPAFQNNHIKMNILIVEGFLIYNYPFTRDICDIKFHLDLSFEVCLERRSNRVYDPPDVESYFEAIVWPHYLKYFAEFRDNSDIVMMNGGNTKEDILNCVLQHLKHFKLN